MIPVASRQTKVSVNFFLRQARNLFSPDVLRHLDIELPNPLPFTGIQFEPRKSLKYRSEFDIKKLIQTAKDSLSEHQPELFKIFLLAVMAGLRRKEIDLLEWGAFQWQHGCTRIEATRWFQPKSEDSIGDVQVDPEVLEIFRGYRARAIGGFVIESTRRPRLGVTYQYYRCQELFERLTIWLRENGVKDNKPLHVLRKEYGSQICAIHGIHAASRAPRHADIRVTNEYYTDSQVDEMPFSRAITYKLIDAGLISSVVVTWPGSRRGRGLIDGDSLDSYLERLTAKQALAPLDSEQLS
jgi:integrase